MNISFDKNDVGVSIMHLGPGAFHRAHQAVYTHDLIEKTGGDYGICAVSLRSSGVRDLLECQNFDYTLVILDKAITYKTIKSIREILVAHEDPKAVIERLSDPKIKTVTLTITEKGYTLGADGEIDFRNPDILHDWSSPDVPKSAVGFLVAGLAARRELGLKGLMIISCDNLPDNGKKLEGIVKDFAILQDPELAKWISETCHFPCTMVDSITPATTGELREQVLSATGQDDRWPIQREKFTQWVIEDIPGANIPPWDKVGATFSTDVAGYEAAKLRILNGLHSTMTFLGLLLGLKTVEEAALHPTLRPVLERLCMDEIIPTLTPVTGLDLNAYAQSIFARFENPTITHYLAQIFWDSSKKLPIRILDSLQDNLDAGRNAPLLKLSAAAWMATAKLYAREERDMTDPLSKTLLAIKSQDTSKYLEISEVFSSALKSNGKVAGELDIYYIALTAGPDATLNLLKSL